jgi:2'-5' RNA ligase
VGAFPSHDYISVVWLGVAAGSAQLTALHEAIEAAYVDAGFDPADHDFTPHVTLARMKHAGGKAHVQNVLERLDPTPGTMRVTEVRLTKSERGREGPVYSTVCRVSLAE